MHQHSAAKSGENGTKTPHIDTANIKNGESADTSKHEDTKPADKTEQPKIVADNKKTETAESKKSEVKNELSNPTTTAQPPPEKPSETSKPEASKPTDAKPNEMSNTKDETVGSKSDETTKPKTFKTADAKPVLNAELNEKSSDATKPEANKTFDTRSVVTGDTNVKSSETTPIPILIKATAPVETPKPVTLEFTPNSKLIKSDAAVDSKKEEIVSPTTQPEVSTSHDLKPPEPKVEVSSEKLKTRNTLAEPISGDAEATVSVGNKTNADIKIATKNVLKVTDIHEVKPIKIQEKQPVITSHLEKPKHGPNAEQAHAKAGNVPSRVMASEAAESGHDVSEAADETPSAFKLTTTMSKQGSINEDGEIGTMISIVPPVTTIQSP
jgi:hypothetical protein